MTTKEEIRKIVENKEVLIAQKKAATKHGDGFSFAATTISKANAPVTGDADSIKVKAIINTTNFLDSHKDVHIPGIWTKSLKENRMVMHLQEHQLAFDKIIADGEDLNAYAKTFNWTDLGYSYKGTTEALVFESTVKMSRNKFMFEQYKQAHVKNHSVGMQYVKLILCVNDEEYGAEHEAWQKYYPMIANKEEADATGYFWAVTEAKVIEGSAVPIGSNTATPTLENNMKGEPSDDTHKEAANQHFDFGTEIKTIKIF